MDISKSMPPYFILTRIRAKDTLNPKLERKQLFLLSVFSRLITIHATRYFDERQLVSRRTHSIDPTSPETLFCDYVDCLARVEGGQYSFVEALINRMQ